ncbi:pyridoxine 5'-phosphate synthase [PVC group bacterium]|nr:pyridoxine 5'-phosphate synthase [PVC group bacterium]
MKLGVNIDHVATLRQARRGNEPDPAVLARLALEAGCDGITLHLREDRRHVQDHDLKRLRNFVKTRLNLEMALSDEIINIALEVKPDQVTFVPEKREEITTEGGLDVLSGLSKLKDVIPRFQKQGIVVSLFIDPIQEQIQAASRSGAEFIEIHTGAFAEKFKTGSFEHELNQIHKAVHWAKNCGLRINAGHGLDCKNIVHIVPIKEIEEVNIGHSIVSRAVVVGMEEAVREIKKLLR